MSIKCCGLGSDAGAKEGAGKGVLLELLSDDKVGKESWESECGTVKELWLGGKTTAVRAKGVGMLQSDQPPLGSQSSEVLELGPFPG